MSAWVKLGYFGPLSALGEGDVFKDAFALQVGQRGQACRGLAWPFTTELAMSLNGWARPVLDVEDAGFARVVEKPSS